MNWYMQRKREWQDLQEGKGMNKGRIREERRQGQEQENLMEYTHWFMEMNSYVTDKDWVWGCASACMDTGSVSNKFSLIQSRRRGRRSGN
jgi:hypothetical protein